MDEKNPSRRSVLKSSAAIASLGIASSLSGCSSIPFVGGNGGGSADDRISKVPEGSTFVFHVNVAGMLGDDTVRQRVNELIQEESGSGGPQSLDDVFSQAETQAGFDPSNVSEMMAFGSVETNTAGSILWTNWEDEAVTTAMTENGYSEDSYGGKTIFVPDSSMSGGTQIARLESSTYAFGTQQSVNAIVDTWTGDSASVSGDVETAFTAAQGGYVQFGFDVPTEQLQQGGGGMNMQAIQNIEYGYGSVTNADNGREMIVKMEASDQDAASGIKGLVDIGLGSVKQQLEQAAQQSQSGGEDISQFQDAVNNVTTSQNGTTVTIKNSDGITFAIGALAVVATFAVGVGSSSGSASMSSEATPQAAFEADYTSGTLTLTHAGGDSIPARSLIVVSQGGQSATWAEIGGSTSMSVNGQPAVGAGDTVELPDIGSDYEIRLVWRSDSTSAVLFQVSGPDA